MLERSVSALAGLTIIDTTEGVAGGYCTKLLAGFGADVLKIERPRVGDALRRAGPFLDDLPNVETSALHLHLNTGKRSVTLDVTFATGRHLLRVLASTADVLIAPDADLIRDVTSALPPGPRPLTVSITPFGATGPHAGWRATDLIAHAAGGYLSMTGDLDREPVRPYGHQSEYQGGLHAALGIVAALAAGEHPDRAPIEVDVAIAEASTFLTGAALARSAIFDRESARNGPRPVGFSDKYLYPSTIRPCLDGHVYTHRHNRFPDLLAALMQEPRLADRDLLASPLGHADETDALMDRWLASRDKWRAVAEAQELRVPFTEVLDPGEVVDDRLRQLTARNFFTDVAHPVAGVVRQPGAPVLMPASPWQTRRAPLLGEHNNDVYRGQLRLNEREMTRLVAAGVI